MKKIFWKSSVTIIIEIILGLLITNLFSIKANEIMFWIIIIGLLIILFQLVCLYYFMNKIDILIDKYKKLKKGIEIVATRTGCIEDVKAAEKFIKSNKDLAN